MVSGTNWGTEFLLLNRHPAAAQSVGAVQCSAMAGAVAAISEILKAETGVFLPPPEMCGNGLRRQRRQRGRGKERGRKREEEREREEKRERERPGII